MESHKILSVEKLQIFFDLAISTTPPKPFFEALHSFIVELYSNRVFEPIINVMKSKRVFEHFWSLDLETKSNCLFTIPFHNFLTPDQVGYGLLPKESYDHRLFEKQTVEGSWKQLDLFFQLSMNFDKILVEQEAKNNQLVIQMLIRTRQDLEKSIDRIDTSNKSDKFTVDQYKHHLKIVFCDVKEKLLSAKPTELPPTKTTWSYCPETGILTINNTPIQFKKDGLPAFILTTITKNKRSQKKLWNWDEMNEKWKKNYRENDNERPNIKFYDAYDQINARILSEAKVENFLLIPDTHKVQLNPLLKHH